MKAAPVDRDSAAPSAWIAAAIVVALLLVILCGLGVIGFLMLDRGLSLRSPIAAGPFWSLRREATP